MGQRMALYKLQSKEDGWGSGTQFENHLENLVFNSAAGSFHDGRAERSGRGLGSVSA